MDTHVLGVWGLDQSPSRGNKILDSRGVVESKGISFLLISSHHHIFTWRSQNLQCLIEINVIHIKAKTECFSVKSLQRMGLLKNKNMSVLSNIGILMQRELKMNCGMSLGGGMSPFTLTFLILKITFPWETIYWSQSGTKAARLRPQRMSSISNSHYWTHGFKVSANTNTLIQQIQIISRIIQDKILCWRHKE